MRPGKPVRAGGVQHDWKQQPCIAEPENPDRGLWDLADGSQSQIVSKLPQGILDFGVLPKGVKGARQESTNGTEATVRYRYPLLSARCSLNLKLIHVIARILKEFTRVRTRQ